MFAEGGWQFPWENFEVMPETLTEPLEFFLSIVNGIREQVSGSLTEYCVREERCGDELLKWLVSEEGWKV